MSTLKEKFNDITKTQVVIGVLVAVILYLGWKLSKRSDNRLTCEECVSGQDGLLPSKMPGLDPNQTQKYTMVLYYATWCGHSRDFLPVWEQFEEYATANLTDIKAVKIKCEGDKESFCSQKGVEGYPTVMLHSQAGETVKFNGDRSLEELIEFSKRYSK